MAFITRRLYTVIVTLGLPFAAIRLLVKGVGNRAYLKRIRERFGFGISSSPCDIWVHAVSVGEVNAAVPLIQTMLAESETTRIMLTTTTPTGSAQVKRHFDSQPGRRVHHSYCPYDIPAVVGRFLDRIRPDLLVLLETEIWPNIIHVCRERGIDVVLVNARLSERSRRRYARLPMLTRDTLSKIRIAAQTNEHRDRFIELGARPDAVHVCGNLKFDIDVDDATHAKGRLLRSKIGAERVVFIAGSTRDGEETLLLDVFEKLKARYLNLLFIVVPRHPERFDQVVRLCTKRSQNVERRTEFPDGPSPTTDIYVGDTMGELTALYVASDIAFIGGSLKPLGGQNMLEAVAAGTPPIFGPSIYNFEEIANALVKQGAGFRVKNLNELTQCVARLIDDNQARRQAEASGRDLMNTSRGATSRYVNLIGLNRKF